MMVVLTRPEDPGHGLEKRLKAAGFEAFHEPVADISPMHHAGELLAEEMARSPRVLIVTSQQGVKILAQQGYGHNLPIYTVGAATADAAQKLGFSHVHYGGGTAMAMVGEITRRYVPSEEPMLHVSGREVAQDVAGLLRAAGYECRRVVVYESKPRSRFSDAFISKLKAGDIAAVTFLSEAATKQFIALVNTHDLVEYCANVVAVCNSARRARPLDATHWRGVHIAGKPTLASLVKSVHHARHGKTGTAND